MSDFNRKPKFLAEGLDNNSSIILENIRLKNFHKIKNAPYSDEFVDAAQRARWLRVCTNYQYSRLVRNGNDLDFALIFCAWKGIDLLPITTMTKKQKIAVYLTFFEGTYSR